MIDIKYHKAVYQIMLFLKVHKYVEKYLERNNTIDRGRTLGSQLTVKWNFIQVIIVFSLENVFTCYSYNFQKPISKSNENQINTLVVFQKR